MKKPLLVGNWKMHGCQKANERLLMDLARHEYVTEIGVCVPFVYIDQAKRLLKNTSIAIGAQNVSRYEVGAYTGEISVSMLVDMECQYVIIGHSERRQLFHETDGDIAEKVLKALEGGLVPILCVGETSIEREQGKTLPRIQAQLQAVLSTLPAGYQEDFVIAYEPLWAIGTGVCATPEQISEVHEMIENEVCGSGMMDKKRLRILYGGSVKPENADEIFAIERVNGALVGGASLSGQDFLSIYESLEKSKKDR